MGDVTWLQGPVEVLNGELVLTIPVSAGGRELAAAARGISEVRNEHLTVRIPAWLAQKLGIHEGSIVQVDNQGGKFNIHPVADS
jgi:hypothetical protein